MTKSHVFNQRALRGTLLQRSAAMTTPTAAYYAMVTIGTILYKHFLHLLGPTQHGFLGIVHATIYELHKCYRTQHQSMLSTSRRRREHRWNPQAATAAHDTLISFPRPTIRT